jgi:hypothetical protein
LRIDKCGIELWNRPRPTQGCRVVRRGRYFPVRVKVSVTEPRDAVKPRNG